MFGVHECHLVTIICKRKRGLFSTDSKISSKFSYKSNENKQRENNWQIRAETEIKMNEIYIILTMLNRISIKETLTQTRKKY